MARCRAGTPRCPLCADLRRSAEHVLGEAGCLPLFPASRRRRRPGGAPLSPGAGAGLLPMKRSGDEEQRLDSGTSRSSSGEGDTAGREFEPPAAFLSGASSWEVAGGRGKRKGPRLKNRVVLSSLEYEGDDGGGTVSATAEVLSPVDPSEG